MKRMLVITMLLVWALVCCAGAAADDAEVPRSPFPDLKGIDDALAALSAENPEVPSTRAYPVSARRTVRADSEDVRTILIYADGIAEPLPCYAAGGETVLLRMEIAQSDDPARMGYADDGGTAVRVADLLNPESGGYVCEQKIGDGESRHYSCGMLSGLSSDGPDPDRIGFFLIRDEAYIGEVTELLSQSGYTGVRWEYTEQAEDGDAGPAQAYILHITDQNGAPVPGTYVNFCTDTTCSMAQSDITGTVIFGGAPVNYHVQLLKVPAGYRFEPGFELYTGSEYGEWVLRVTKD